VFGVLSVRDDGTDAASPRRLSVGLGVVTLVAENGPGRDVRPDVEQDLEVAAVAGLAYQPGTSPSIRSSNSVAGR
jgi:hypothetical protein